MAKRACCNVRRTSKGWIEYDITWIWPEGGDDAERRKCPIQTLTGAKAWAKERERNVYEMGRETFRRGSAPLFSKFAERCIAEHDEANGHKPSTIRTKRINLAAHLLQRFGARAMDTFDDGDIAKLKSDLQKDGLSAKTINNILSDLGVIFTCAVEWKVISAHQAPRIKLMKRAKPKMPTLTREQYTRRIAAARELVDKRPLVVLLLGGDAGLRKGEMLALDWRNVDLGQKLISVVESQTEEIVTATKGNNWRVVPMTDALHEALEALPNRSGRVFKGRAAHGGIADKTLVDLMRDVEEAAGEPITGHLHVLRHTFGSLGAQNAQSIYLLQAAMGHTDIKTTEGYAKLTAAALRPLVQEANTLRESQIASDKIDLGDSRATARRRRSQNRKLRVKTKEIAS